MSDVAVIGAGIAGLTAAYRLQRAGLNTVVFEASDRVGGVIRTERSDGFLVEHGPNSVQSESGVLDELVRSLGLENNRVTANAAARNRYIIRGGRPQPAPMSPMKLATSDLFGPGAKLRLLREPFVPPGDPSVEESVADFIRRRLGQEFLDYAMNPFVGGVYAGDPGQLSIRYALPGIYQMEQESGSILKGQVDKRRGASPAMETHRMYSFDEGMAQLPSALQRTLGSAVRTDSPAKELMREGSGWSVNGERCSAVIYAAPLHRLSKIRLPSEIDVTLLHGVVHPPMSIVALGYRRGDVRHPLDGFGMLVPAVERSFRILGTLFTSSVFSRRAPEGHVLLTSFLGGMRRPQLAGGSSERLFQIVREDLGGLLGATGSPVHQRHVFWEHSIPQYNIGYGLILETIDQLERDFPGLFFAGNYRAGVSVGDAASSGDAAARRSLDYLPTR